jgi:hypothetical protein
METHFEPGKDDLFRLNAVFTVLDMELEWVCCAGKATPPFLI